MLKHAGKVAKAQAATGRQKATAQNDTGADIYLCMIAWYGT